jgi:hypothetical protein
MRSAARPGPAASPSSPFPAVEFPPVEPHAGLIYLSQTDCIHCGHELEDDPNGTHDAERVDRWCDHCGSRYYSTPARESEMRTEEKLHVRPWEWGPSPDEREAERRRRFRIANLARALNALATVGSDQARGYAFEQVMGQLFKVEGLTYDAAYRRRGTQIDGALELEGWVYLVETRWRRGRATWQDLVALRTKVKRSSRQTMGLFVSVNGFTSGGIEVLKAESDQVLILMDGSDIGAVLLDQMRLRPLLLAKARHLSLQGEPLLMASEVLARSASRGESRSAR